MTTEHKPHSEHPIEDWLTSTELCVSCPDCAFTFDSGHTDQGGGYSCPVCAEIRLEEQYEGALATIEILQDKEAMSDLLASSEEELNGLREQLEGAEYRASKAQHQLSGLMEQLEAAQAAIRELHEEMWTVQDGDGPEFISAEGLKYLRSWFDRTGHLTGVSVIQERWEHARVDSALNQTCNCNHAECVECFPASRQDA